jgi:molybdopterin synthase catalytic subunit
MTMADVTRVPDLTTEMLSDEQAMERFAVPCYPAASGAVVTFLGVVRDHDSGREVIELEYVAHPSAPQVLRQATQEVAARHPDVATIRVGHRTGLLAIGQRALFAEVSSAHRAEAFAACSELVDHVKCVLPVWKRQVFSDGSQEWVNSP